jgi:transposase
LEKIININGIITDMKNMEGLTLKEIAEQLGIAPKTAQKRIMRARCKPKAYAGPTAIYDPSALEAIREVATPGRPRKAAGPEAEPEPTGKGEKA